MDRAAADLNGRSFPVRLTTSEHRWQGEIRIDDAVVTGALARSGTGTARLSGAVADWHARIEHLPSSLNVGEVVSRLLAGPVAEGAITMTLGDMTLWFRFRGDQVDEVVFLDGGERIGTASLDLTEFLVALGTAMRRYVRSP